MYGVEPFSGADLPQKTLCLTYDDGPGDFTYEIAKFLNEQEIRATFFVVGKYASHRPKVLSALSSFKHIIGNHTYDHPELTYYVSSNGNVQDQILRTDTIIKEYLKGETVYFRSPYGKWSAEVAQELNSNILSTYNHVGPIHWDIAGIDCYYWQKQLSLEAAAEQYRVAIGEKGRGIIVMHDDIADMDYVKQNNQTLELTKLLIPELKAQGYKFVCLNEVPSVKKAVEKQFEFYLIANRNRYLFVDVSGPYLSLKKVGKNAQDKFILLDKGFGKVALKTGNGCYLGLNPDNNLEVFAIDKDISEHNLFDLIPVFDNRVMFRAYTGRFLTIDKKNSDRLVATAQFIRVGTHFNCNPLNIGIKDVMSVETEILLLRKKFSYIRSKLLVNKKFGRY